MTVSTNVPRERWNQPHEREHLAAAYCRTSNKDLCFSVSDVRDVGEDLWRCDQCGEALT